MVYSTLQASSLYTKLLIIRWKASRQQQVRKYGMHRVTLDSTRPRDGCLLSIVRQKCIIQWEPLSTKNRCNIRHVPSIKHRPHRQ